MVLRRDEAPDDGVRAVGTDDDVEGPGVPVGADHLGVAVVGTDLLHTVVEEVLVVVEQVSEGHPEVVPGDLCLR